MSELKFSIATATGRAAIATIIVYGENAISAARQVFQPRNRRIELTSSFGRVVYGNWIADGNLGEDLIICPISENHFEIHCHGSIAAIEIIIQTLQKHGAKQVSANEMACYLSGSSYFADLLLATAMASTARTAKLLLKQKELHRKFWQTIRRLVEEEQERLAIPLIDDFLSFEHFGNGLTKPFKVVFCGSPNVGKSSIVNTILGFNRAIVHDTAGTTRDAVSEVTVIDGWPIILTDTAGIRESADQIEEHGIRITQQSIADADLTVLVVDLSTETDYSINHQIASLQPDLVVGNKLDLANNDFEHVKLKVSAIEHTNINQLMQGLIEVLVPECPPESQAIPVTELQAQTAMKIRQSIQASDFDGVSKALEAILVE